MLARWSTTTLTGGEPLFAVALSSARPATERLALQEPACLRLPAGFAKVGGLKTA